MWPKSLWLWLCLNAAGPTFPGPRAQAHRHVLAPGTVLPGGLCTHRLLCMERTPSTPLPDSHSDERVPLTFPFSRGLPHPGTGSRSLCSRLPQHVAPLPPCATLSVNPCLTACGSHFLVSQNTLGGPAEPGHGEMQTHAPLAPTYGITTCILLRPGARHSVKGSAGSGPCRWEGCLFSAVPGPRHRPRKQQHRTSALRMGHRMNGGTCQERAPPQRASLAKGRRDGTDAAAWLG